MTAEQFTTLLAIVGFIGGAAAILRYRTLQTAVDSLSAVVGAQKEELAVTKSKNIELRETNKQQEQRIKVLESTVNSSELITQVQKAITSLDLSLSKHHAEAMTGLEMLHADLTNLRTDITGLQRAVNSR